MKKWIFTTLTSFLMTANAQNFNYEIIDLNSIEPPTFPNYEMVDWEYVTQKFDPFNHLPILIS